MMNKNIKKIVLSHKFLYEIYFFIARKKINRRKLDLIIRKSLDGKKSIKKEITKGLIVSLTSYGERLADLKYTLLSLVSQSIRPEKIIVWLAFGEEISNELNQFVKYGVEYKYCEDTKSYTKLIPALKEFSDKNIVTADDDIFYKKDWLKKLWDLHLENPNSKITHIAHRLCFDEKKLLKSYNEWIHNVGAASSGKFYFPTGVGGVLYPPHEVPMDFFNEKLFMSLCPNADDVWFYFMGILSGQDTIIVKHPYNHLRYVDVYKEYGLNGKSTLQSINVEQNFNDIQIRNVMNCFGLTDKSLYQLLNNYK